MTLPLKEFLTLWSIWSSAFQVSLVLTETRRFRTKTIPSGGDLAPSLRGGTENFFADQNFGMTFLSEKIFTPKNSDNPFLVIAQVFLIFTLYFQSPYLYCVKCRIWPFLHKKNHFFWKKFLDDTYFLLFYSLRAFTPIRQHYFSKYWGGPMHGSSPTSNFGGTVPPVPPRSPPLTIPLTLDNPSNRSHRMQHSWIA